MWILAVLVCYGTGAGPFQSPNNSAVLGAAPPARIGTAAGTLATVARLGQVSGVALAGGIWQGRLDHYGANPAGTSSAFRDTFLVLAAFGVAAMAVSRLRGKIAPVPPGEVAVGSDRLHVWD